MGVRAFTVDLKKASQPAKRSMKVLLIEDNDSLVHWLTRLLKEERFVVDTAPDGEAADQLLRTQQYDVVLLDLQIPRLSGKNVLRRLRARHNNVPVLMLTASGAVDEKVECLGLGADDYLVKPFEVRELLARIKALVRRQLVKSRPSSVAAISPTTATRVSFMSRACCWRCASRNTPRSRS
jgi:DNA-binding response OmpR family regulator